MGYPKYLVLSLPRSRSAWLSVFLSNGGTCGHDMATLCPSTAEVRRVWSTVEGSCETGAMIAGPLLKKWFPETTFMVIRRDTQEVIDSLRYFLGPYFDAGEIRARAAMLDKFAADNKIAAVDYVALADKTMCEALFLHLTGRYCPAGWWDRMARLNIQIDNKSWLRMLIQNRSRLQKLKDDLAREIQESENA